LTQRQSILLEKARRKIGASRDLLRLGYVDDAVSRAYYAMFYLAEAFLDGEGLRFSSHAAVIGEFGKRFAKTGRVPAEYHRFLLEAQEARHGGDYEDTYLLTVEEAEQHVQRAERFLQIARQLITPSDTPTGCDRGA
jgi:uncharacterized protein (UPF0332 family)